MAITINGSGTITGISTGGLPDGIVDDGTLATSAVTSIKIADGAIAVADIADDAVTLAKMAGGTDGELITYDTLGDPAKVAVGTLGHVLTSGGAGVAPTFQAAAAGGVAGIVSSADATAMTITSAERIGVGDTTPDAKFEIYATTETALNVVSSVSGEYTAQFKSGSTNATPIIHCQDSAAATILQVLADGRGLSQFTAKAWVNFSGTGSPISIRANHNVSTIGDNGIGQYTVNFTNALGSADYAGSGATASDTKVIVLGANSTSSVGLDVRQTTNGTHADTSRISLIVFGD